MTPSDKCKDMLEECAIHAYLAQKPRHPEDDIPEDQASVISVCSVAEADCEDADDDGRLAVAQDLVGDAIGSFRRCQCQPYKYGQRIQPHQRYIDDVGNAWQTHTPPGGNSSEANRQRFWAAVSAAWQKHLNRQRNTR